MPVASKSSRQKSTAHFTRPKHTEDFHAVVVVNDDYLDIGDEIAFFNNNGLLLGASTVDGKITPVSLWYDDKHTDIVDGYIVGDHC